MVAHIETVAFLGVEARPVDVQVQIVGGAVSFSVVGLADNSGVILSAMFTSIRSQTAGNLGSDYGTALLRLMPLPPRKFT